MKTYPKICVSVAGNPSPLGVKMHNAAYNARNLDYTYVAMGSESIEDAIKCIELLSIRGMGVSMPFKQDVINHLDVVDDSVTAIGACNTVVNNDNVLYGYNTDWVGAQDAIKETIDINTLESAVIIGAGGVARAIAYALKKNGLKVYISARNPIQRKTLVADLNLDGETDLEHQGDFNTDLVVNATPDATENGPVNLEMHKNVQVVFDVVFNQYMTYLTTRAKDLGKKYVSGWRMLVLQGAEQFRLYIGESAPVDDMSNVILEWLNSAK